MPASVRTPLPSALLVLALTTTGIPMGTACATEGQTRVDAPAGTTRTTDDAVAAATTVTAKYDPRRSLAPMLKKVMPTVVSVRARGRASRSGNSPHSIPPWFAPQGRGPLVPIPSAGIGSGFIISSDGHVVTNHHVVSGHTEFDVKLGDGRTVTAKVVGSDPPTDLALLQLEGAGSQPHVTMGSSDSLEVGDWVVAVGSPMGLEQTATTGIVSAKGRGSLNLYRSSYIDFLQTDAPISPGSSGGPLFNLKGEVVGINTAVNGVGQGLGFAIPSSHVKRVIKQLRATGTVTRGWLGIAGRDVEPASGDTRDPGGVVGEVYEGTPAAEAGLQSGDRITSVDGKKVRDFMDFRGRIADFAPGEKVRLGLVRGEKAQTVTATLGLRPEQDQLEKLQRPDRGPRPDRDGSLYDDDKPRLGVEVTPSKRGLVIKRVAPDGLADRLGLEVGDEVFEINGVKIKAVEDVSTALGKDRGRVNVKVHRGDAIVSAIIQRG